MDIDDESLKQFYRKRAKEKSSINIDAPVVLVGDQDIDKIEEWTRFEVEFRLPLLQLDQTCRVLEIGCGTGRISKFITPHSDVYVGVDYVEEFIKLIETRKDIIRNKSTYFKHASIMQLINEEVSLPNKGTFNRIIISGGVLMYINDDEVGQLLSKINDWVSDECIIYFSEPIALKQRLTLNKFYSNDLKSEYSAIYRTEDEYKKLFGILYNKGFKLSLSEEFFYEDLKTQKETKQWMFILKNA